jgi:transcriptional regulator GlxA family with amidase domain
MRTVNVYFVLQPDTLLLDLSGPAEVLAMANRCAPTTPDGVPLRFALHYVGASPAVATSIGLPLNGLAPLPDAPGPDALLFLIGSVDMRRPLGDAAPSAPAAAYPDNADALADIETLVRWLRGLQRDPATLPRIACICTGAMLAARAGLLDGVTCTTHHSVCGSLQALAPRAKVVDNRLFVNDGRISSSAGITAGIDLALHLLAESCGAHVAATIARNLVIYARRGGNDPQLSPWLSGRNHLHPALHRVQDAIAADPARAWSLPELAAIACSSERHLARLFREHTGAPALDYVQRLRVALARELLLRSQWDLEHVAQRSGFGSARHLRRIWHKFDPLPPARWRTQHGLSVQ